MTISTITISAVDYTAYASVAEADPYLAVDALRAAAWAALSTDQKGANLVAATRRLDMLNWLGTKTGGAAQENAWPRTGLTYADDGAAVSTTEVPQEVENATILIAGDIALKASNQEAGNSDQNFKRVKAGSAEIEFFKPVDGVPIQNEGAFSMLKQFLAGNSSAAAALGIYAGGTVTTCYPTSPGLSDGFS